jgi:hypothetical protein
MRALVPEDLHPAAERRSLMRTAAGQALARQATALFLATVQRRSLPDVVRQNWPSDRAVTRGAVSPAATNVSGWAAELAGDAVADAIVGLAPAAAGAVLISRGVQLSLAGVGSIRLPGRLVTAADAGAFVSETAPIPAVRLNFGAGPMLQPNKFAVLVSFTNELARYAVTDIEALIKRLLGDAAALALDAAIFSATAAVPDLRPGGILVGVTPITPTAGGGVDAIAGDVRKLLAALHAAGAGIEPIFVAAPPEAAILKVWSNGALPVFASSALASGSVVAVEASSFVSAFSGAPQFDVGDASVIHQETDPDPIGAPGSPPVVAAPARSLWQTDCTAVRMIVRTAWGMRAVGHVALLTGAQW